MKKTLKLVAIFAAILVVGIAAVVSGYILISKNKTYYIYDLRIIEPIASRNGYIYKGEGEYISMKNKKVYMTSEEENFLEIAVFADVSANINQLKIYSSNPSVARVIVRDRKCFVNYISAGEATITTSLGGVTDSFVISVYDQVSTSFGVYDYAYYGASYASYFPNNIIGYADDVTYSYDYLAFSAAGEMADDVLNNNLLKIDQSKLNKDVFKSVSIDAENKKLVVTCNSGLEDNIDEQIAIQSFTYNANGEESITNNYVVNVHVVAYTPEFLQMVVSKSPNFEDDAVFVNTQVIDNSTLTEENITTSKELLTDYLAYKKAENYLAEIGEKATYNLTFTSKVDTLYIKFRKVYTNGDIVYLNESNRNEIFSLGADMSYLKPQPTGDYYKLVLTADYFATPETTFNIVLGLLDYNLAHTFKIEFTELNQSNVDKFYQGNSEGFIDYIYWDPRTRYDNEIYDENGNLIEVAGMDIEIPATQPPAEGGEA